ncbi:MAG: hypothetical protein WDZ41_03895 [Candidatus Babeliales bacterium]
MFDQIKRNLYVFGWFLYRDFFIFSKNWHRVAINFGLFIPVSLTFCFGYILPNSNMINPSPEQITTFFVGSILWTLFPLAFVLNIDLLYDLEHDRFIDYQISILNPRLILIEKIFFSSLIAFVTSCLFYPVSRLLLGSYFYAAHFSWPALLMVLYMGSLFCAAFNIFVLSFIESTKKTGIFWMRINNPMISLGGLFIPWYVMKIFSPLLGYFILLNPLIYLTEGLRRAIIGDVVFLPIWLCVSMLFLFMIFFTLLAIYFFKKKIDHI